MRTMLSVAVLLLATQAQAATCPLNDTVGGVLAPGFSCTVDDKTFSGFDITGAPAAYGIYDRHGRPYPARNLAFSRAVESGEPVVVDDLGHRSDQANIDFDIGVRAAAVLGVHHRAVGRGKLIGAHSEGG